MTSGSIMRNSYEVLNVSSSFSSLTSLLSPLSHPLSSFSPHLSFSLFIPLPSVLSPPSPHSLAFCGRRWFGGCGRAHRRHFQAQEADPRTAERRHAIRPRQRTGKTDGERSRGEERGREKERGGRKPRMASVTPQLAVGGYYRHENTLGR